MKRDVHIQLPKDIVDKVEYLSKVRKKSKVDIYIELLKLGLDHDNLFKKINIMEEVLISNYKDISYMKRLLQQIYADLNLEQIQLSKSENLNKFNIEFRKKRNKFND